MLESYYINCINSENKQTTKPSTIEIPRLPLYLRLSRNNECDRDLKIQG